LLQFGFPLRTYTGRHVGAIRGSSYLRTGAPVCVTADAFHPRVSGLFTDAVALLLDYCPFWTYTFCYLPLDVAFTHTPCPGSWLPGGWRLPPLRGTSRLHLPATAYNARDTTATVLTPGRVYLQNIVVGFLPPACRTPPPPAAPVSLPVALPCLWCVIYQFDYTPPTTLLQRPAARHVWAFAYLFWTWLAVPFYASLPGRFTCLRNATLGGCGRYTRVTRVPTCGVPPTALCGCRTGWAGDYRADIAVTHPLPASPLLPQTFGLGALCRCPHCVAHHALRLLPAPRRLLARTY